MRCTSRGDGEVDECVGEPHGGHNGEAGSGALLSAISGLASIGVTTAVPCVAMDTKRNRNGGVMGAAGVAPLLIDRDPSIAGGGIIFRRAGPSNSPVQVHVINTELQLRV